MMVQIDLNADLGEGGAYDEELLTIVSSCNIACGGHAGDESSMWSTVKAAISQNVAVGAHPSYPDRDGFGRRSKFLAGDALLASLIDQVSALRTILTELQRELLHVKPHGALYNDAAVDAELANTIVQAISKAAPGAALVGLPGSCLEQAAAQNSSQFIAEAFIDRAYRPDGQLVPRSEVGAVLTDIDVIVSQAVSLVVQADTLCVHGDTPRAAEAATAVRAALEARGTVIRAVRRR